jgi:hypothetical protein
MTGSQIEPGLFDLLDEYSAGIAGGTITPGRAVAESSKVITFLHSFFDQLFAACFNIELEAFDDESKRMSVALRHEQDVPADLRPVVSAFEEFCDLYPDVVGASYGGGSSTTFRRFHKRYLPRLLRSACQWAVKSGQQDLGTRIGTSAEAFNEALGAAKW